MTESRGFDPNVFHFSRNAPLKSIVGNHGYSPCTSTNFLTNSIKENTPSTSKIGAAPNSNGNAPLPHFNFYVILP